MSKTHDADIIDYNACLMQHGNGESYMVTSLDIRAKNLAQAVEDLLPLIGFNQTIELMDYRIVGTAAIIYADASVKAPAEASHEDPADASLEVAA
nr:hypothetical protein [uncultured Cohaesibacter sp.]